MPHYFFSFFAYQVDYLFDFSFHFNEIEVIISFSFPLGQVEREISRKKHTTRVGLTSVGEMKRITEGRNSYSCSWALRGGQWHRKWWFSLWFWPWWIRLTSVTLCLFWNSIKNKFAMIKNWKFCCGHPPLPHPLPFVPVSINYFTFKENLSELQPYLGNGYLVSRSARNNVSECSF